MEAPQYPKGLHLHAYGTGMTGDVRELNILNHYIGMPPIEAPALETAMFPIGIALLVALCLLSPLHRWLRRAGARRRWPRCRIGILADLQWRLYTFGHSLNPDGADPAEAVHARSCIGATQMGNFESHGDGVVGRGLPARRRRLLVLGDRSSRRYERPHGPSGARTVGARGTRPPLCSSVRSPWPCPSSASAQRGPRCRRGSTPRRAAAPSIVDGGVHRGPIVIRGPLTVVGRQRRDHRRRRRRQRGHHRGRRRACSAASPSATADGR